jgi:hypothetical protein
MLMSRSEPKVSDRHMITTTHPTRLILPVCARPQQSLKPLTNPSQLEIDSSKINSLQ